MRIKVLVVIDSVGEIDLKMEKEWYIGKSDMRKRREITILYEDINEN